MDYNRPNNSENLLTLQEAALKLGVSVDVLLRWNDYHILSPKITMTGQIGYTKEQISQFLIIQQTLVQAPEKYTETVTRTMPLIQPSESVEKMSLAQVHQQPFKAPSKLMWTGIVMGATAFLLVLFTQQGRIMSAISSLETSYQTASTKKIGTSTSAAQITDPMAVVSPSQLKDESGNKFNSSQQSAFSQNIFAPTSTPKKAVAGAATSNKYKQTTTTTKIVRAASDQEAQVTPLPTQEAAVADTTTYARISQQGNNNPNNTLNGNGIITGGTANSTVIASILGAGMVGENNVSQQVNIDMKNQIIFLMVSAMIVVMLLLRRRRDIIVAPAGATLTAIEKVLEVNQKMDGTVVLIFQGKEYKISKPELDSDSDKFIERLMQLMQHGTKEMEYESLTDTIRLTAPLSRLVTRLGFVGIKRDLFFPRTSKHRVLFRKYITPEDLMAMHISPAEIAHDLSLLA